MRFEHNRGTALKISKAVTFDTVLKLRRPVLGDDTPDINRAVGSTSSGPPVAEYCLIATVSHHGRNAAGGSEWRLLLDRVDQ
jgi:hypothetical protein